MKDSYCKRSGLYDSPRCVTGCSKYKEWPNQSFSWHCTKFIGSIDRHSPCVMFAVSAYGRQASCCPIRPVPFGFGQADNIACKTPAWGRRAFLRESLLAFGCLCIRRGRENCRSARNASFQQGGGLRPGRSAEEQQEGRWI